MDRPALSGNDPPLRQLVALSRHYGADSSFVLAGGGNTSVKVEDRLFVKASGVALAALGEDGFVEMDRAALERIVRTAPEGDETAREARYKEAVLAARIHPGRGQRPSVECVLHHALPCRFVVHTHATLVNMVTCCVRGEALARQMLGDDLLWIPYVDPGWVLARTLQERLDAWRSATGRTCPPAVLMASHGLIVCGDTADEVLGRTDRVVGAVRARLDGIAAGDAFGTVTRLAPDAARAAVLRIAPALRGLLGGPGRLRIVTFDDGPDALALAGGAEGRAAAAAGPLTPDQIVYCKSFPLWFEPDPGAEAAAETGRLRDAVAEYVARHGFPPVVTLVRGLGLFAAGDDRAGADTARQVYLDAVRVMTGSRRLGGTVALTPRDREFIERWEVEAYRRAVAAGGRVAGRAAGKVALVTGAARGFGLEIATDLAAQGAHVALADVNREGAAAAADAVCAAAGPGRATGLAVNVADSASVAEAVHAVVRTFGGLDLLVSNAGVLRAGGVVSQPPEDFRFVTDVNYTGYFLCVKHAAPVMALQRRVRPETQFDIIQINSKSGLVGSNRNGAYAGSKFGGIGLTQSFALELIEDGIKVNAVCPGNFFDGPLWSDPANGLFVQYLKSGKVPGAQTVADVRRAYESKIPMGRGCATADVMKAIYYLMEQQYETGQALPVTGGQVMLG